MQDSFVIALVKLVSRPEAWALVVCSLGAYFIIASVLSWNRLRHIPGPRSAGWTNWWLVKRTWQGVLPSKLEHVCKQYGPVARVGPNYVICGDPREVRRIWGVRSQFDRAPWYKGFRLDPPNDCSISMIDGEAHAALRLKLAPGYAGKDVDGLQEKIDAGVARFIRLIEERYLSTPTEYRPMDFARKSQYMTLDIIADIAFGEYFGFMENDKDMYDYIQITEGFIPIMPIFALVPWLLSLLQSPLCKSMMPSDKDPVGFGPIIAVAKRVVGQRYGEKAIHRRDMLGSFVKHGASQHEAESESLLQIIAGSDTTAGALRTIVVHILTNPRVCAHLQNEIDCSIKNGNLSSPVTDAEARKLAYLQACIKEGLRMWPPAPAIVPRVSDRDAVICGTHIPAGTNVAWSALTSMRDKGVFGVDAEIFRPDRWILAGASHLQAMENTIDLCFGQGRWGCLGRPIAMMELNKMIVELFRRFDFGIVNAERPIQNMTYGLLVSSDFNLINDCAIIMLEHETIAPHRLRRNDLVNTSASQHNGNAGDHNGTSPAGLKTRAMHNL